MKFLSCGFFAACLLLATQSTSATTTGKHADAHAPPRRLNVLPEQSIATEIQTAHAMGIAKPRFTLHAEEQAGNKTSTINIFAGSDTTHKNDFEVHVREAMPAVTSMTTTSVQGGESRSVNENHVATMRVSDKPGVFALIYVEKTRGKVNGIVKKSGMKDVQLVQDGQGGKVS
jgi:hypothetical protein